MTEHQRMDSIAALFGTGFPLHVLLLMLSIVTTCIVAAINHEHNLNYSGLVAVRF